MKRSLYFALAMILALTAIPAFAATVPSKTTQDMTEVVTEKIVTSTGEVVAADFAVAPTAEVSETTTNQLQTLTQFVTDNADTPIVNYFVKEDDVEMKDAIAALLPEDTDISTFVINEFVPIAISNYDEAYGDMTIPFTFATPYEDGALIFVMAGIATGEIDEMGNDIVIWTPLAAEVVDGEILIHFTQDFLMTVADKEIMLAVFSQPVEEE